MLARGAQIRSRDAMRPLRQAAPPPRKPWMSEDERMSIFDAVALATTLFTRERKEHAVQGPARAA